MPVATPRPRLPATVSNALALLIVVGLPVPTHAQAKPTAAPEADVFARINQAALVFTGKVTRVRKGAVGLTDPPLFSDDLTFAEITVLRGSKPADLTFVRSVTQQEEPEYPAEITWLIAADRFGKDWVIGQIAPADDKLVAVAKQAVALPLGWSLDDGRPISPWAALPERAWSKDASAAGEPVCAKSFRPALSAGDAIEVTAEQVLPARRHQFKNPFGDGRFRITVKNRGDKPAAVPALLSDGRTICWADSLVVIVQGKPQLVPAADTARGVEPTTLKAGASVSTIVDVLPLKNVAWPRGGSRVYFRFCLGEKSAIDFFYYSSDYHDALRDAAAR